MRKNKAVIRSVAESGRELDRLGDIMEKVQKRALEHGLDTAPRDELEAAWAACITTLGGARIDAGVCEAVP